MMIDTLTKLGLTATEALVYVTLLDIGPSFVAPIIQRTKKHRQIVYCALEQLERKHMVSVTRKNGKKFYALSDPQRFLLNAQQQELIAQHAVADIERILHTENEQVESFSGPNAYKDGLADFRLYAEQAREYIVIGGQPEEWYEYAQPFFPAHVEDLRRLRRQGIDPQILFFESERQSAEKYMLPYHHNPYIIKITQHEPRLPHTTWLAGDHVYLLTPTTDPLVIHIKSKALAQVYRTYVDILWKKAEFMKRI